MEIEHGGAASSLLQLNLCFCVVFLVTKWKVVTFVVVQNVFCTFGWKLFRSFQAWFVEKKNCIFDIVSVCVGVLLHWCYLLFLLLFIAICAQSLLFLN